MTVRERIAELEISLRKASADLRRAAGMLERAAHMPMTAKVFEGYAERAERIANIDAGFVSRAAQVHPLDDKGMPPASLTAYGRPPYESKP